jgi:hypothetical protein
MNMTDCCNDKGSDITQKLLDAMEGILGDADKLRKFINGTEEEQVDLGGVDTDTLRRFKAKIDGILDSAISQAEARMQQYVAEAKAEADRVTELIDIGAITSGAFNNRYAWITDDDIEEDGILTLPGHYIPDRDVMLLHFEDVACTPKKPGVVVSGRYQYEEIGTPDTLSNQIKLKFAVPAGSQFDMWTVALTAAQLAQAQAASQAAATSAGQSVQGAQASDNSATQAASALVAVQGIANDLNAAFEAADTIYVRRDVVPEGEEGTVTEGIRTLMQSVTIDTITSTSAIISGWSVDIENGGNTIETQVVLSAATDDAAGLMAAEDHTQITQLTADVLTLQQQGGKFIGQSFATKADLDDYTFSVSDNPGDFTYVEDDETHSDATTRYIIGGENDPDTREWVFGYILESDPVSIATTSALGLVKGSTTDGQIFVETNGSMSLVGYDALASAVESFGVPAATAATATADGGRGTTVLAKDSDAASRDKSATPAGVAALANTVTQFTVLATAIAAGTAFTVPTYVVGAKAGNTAGKRKITVYLYGIAYSCTEIGTTGADSTSVKFADALPIGAEITAVSAV